MKAEGDAFVSRGKQLSQQQRLEERQIQRLEWRWKRRLPQWRRAALQVQAWYRGCLGRRSASQARALLARLLKSRDLHALAEAAIHDGHRDEAVQLVCEIIEDQNPTYWPAYLTRGRLRLHAGDAPGALGDLTSYLARVPDDPIALKTRARLLDQNGNSVSCTVQPITRDDSHRFEEEEAATTTDRDHPLRNVTTRTRPPSFFRSLLSTKKPASHPTHPFPDTASPGVHVA